jgi:hypothetical protein
MKNIHLFENFNTHDNGGKSYSIYKDKDRTFIFKFDEFIPNTEKIFSSNGSSILIKTKNKLEYIFIGVKKIRFYTDEKIKHFKSDIGNSDVVYPYATSENYIYLFIENIILNKKDIPKNITDYYQYYYKNKNINIKKIIPTV